METFLYEKAILTLHVPIYFQAVDKGAHSSCEFMGVGGVLSLLPQLVASIGC